MLLLSSVSGFKTSLLAELDECVYALHLPGQENSVGLELPVESLRSTAR
jgi:hypothetical protein